MSFWTVWAVLIVVVAIVNLCLMAKGGTEYPIPAWQFAAMNGFLLGAGLEHLSGAS